MVKVHSPPPLQLSIEVFSTRPVELDALEAERDRYRSEGRYKEAGDAQDAIEHLKLQEENSRLQCTNLAVELQALADKHAQELDQLDEQQQRDYLAAQAKWDFDLMELLRSIEALEAHMQARHSDERQQFAQQCASEPVRPKWSRQLLNMRVQEEHLIKQRNFPQAYRMKASADELEAYELQQAEAAMRARQMAEETRLLARQAREVEVQRKKLTAQHDEKVLSQERELDRMHKSMKASRVSLQRTQAQERITLEQALKGWFNPKKLGLPPPPLINPSAHSLSPGRKLGLERPRRPETAPGKMGHQPSSQASPSGRSVSHSLSDANQYPDSPVDGQQPQQQPRPRKPWDTPQGSTPNGVARTPGLPYVQSYLTNGMSTTTSSGALRALQPLAGGAAVGIASLSRSSNSRPGTTQAPGARSSGVSTTQARLSTASPVPRSPSTTPPATIPTPNQRNSLTKQALQAHTKATNGPQASVITSRADSGVPAQPQFVVLHK